MTFPFHQTSCKTKHQEISGSALCTFACLSTLGKASRIVCRQFGENASEEGRKINQPIQSLIAEVFTKHEQIFPYARPCPLLGECYEPNRSQQHLLRQPIVQSDHAPPLSRRSISELIF
jgi:hypothetical protein